jgi:hypothetical protein
MYYGHCNQTKTSWHNNFWEGLKQEYQKTSPYLSCLKSSNRNWICKSAGITGGIIAINLSIDKVAVQLELNFLNQAARVDSLRNIAKMLNNHRIEIEAKIESELAWEDGQNRFVVRKNIPSNNLVKNPSCWPVLHKELVVWTEKFKNCFIPLISECRWGGSLKSLDRYKVATDEISSFGEGCRNANNHDFLNEGTNTFPNYSEQTSEDNNHNVDVDLKQSIESDIGGQNEDQFMVGGVNE